jgi:hypothetical protein
MKKKLERYDKTSMSKATPKLGKTRMQLKAMMKLCTIIFSSNTHLNSLLILVPEMLLNKEFTSERQRNMRTIKTNVFIKKSAILVLSMDRVWRGRLLRISQ